MRPLRRVTATTTALGMAAAGLIMAVSGTAHASACSQSYLPLPDSSCTPGSYNPDVTQSNIHSTICVSGWTATVRPSTSYTNPLKAQGIIDYGYSDTNMSDYEEDHLVPLELGGAPRDPGNLWPEPHYGTKTASTKDGTETKLKNAVCNGTITLSAARSAIKNNWTTALQVTGIG
ncbi:hypothetical protein [Streptomyces mirabilis]|uniref:hypothetical protein n=1 Tax=Streptomyces mirabilis TaxID=68239 RepID=UPI00224D2042|nr:hypothetical protein [Streptomyces mirabilis]MCX4429695.1 hypothetical protein [Streptomyces mirabilis]